MSEKTHNKYDKLQKLSTVMWLNAILLLIGIDSEVEEILSSEICTISFKSKFADLLVKLKDGQKIHFEFHRGNIDKKQLARNGSYAADMVYEKSDDIKSVMISLVF